MQFKQNGEKLQNEEQGWAVFSHRPPRKHTRCLDALMAQVPHTPPRPTHQTKASGILTVARFLRKASASSTKRRRL